MTAGVIAAASNIAAVAATSILTPITYIGNGATQAITGAGFRPDLVWVKNRDSSNPHILTDSVRTAPKYLQSNSTASESSSSLRISSLDSDGFSVGAANDVNLSSDNFIGWCFKETSEVFDIVGYVGNGTSQNISHNLGVIPEMMIVKNRDSSWDWAVYHKDLNGGSNPQSYRLLLNLENAETLLLADWNNTAPTSSVFSVGTSARTNGGGENTIAYLFASKAGVCKIDTYSGTGATGNSITGLGFAPSFIMVKNRTVGSSAWSMYDTTRGNNNQLKANSVANEITLNTTLDSDGFTLNSADSDVNASGTNNYVYLALA